VLLHPGHHVGYYPGAEEMHLKLVFERPSGRVLGAQAVGKAGVEKRIDVISMAIQMGATVFDLEEAELCYAPAYGAAKDPVNLAGMIAANSLRGDLELVAWDELDRDSFLVDLRTSEEFAGGAAPGAVNLPLDELRGRLDELPVRRLELICRMGKRAYYGARILSQKGFDVRVVSGGMQSFKAYQEAGLLST